MSEERVKLIEKAVAAGEKWKALAEERYQRMIEAQGELERVVQEREALRKVLKQIEMVALGDNDMIVLMARQALRSSGANEGET